jgi:ATP-dependent Clp protease protease subunit
MEKETWLTAQECFDYGLCDEIVGANQAAAKFDTSIFKNYRNVPKSFKEDEKEPEGEHKTNIDAEKSKLLMELDLI